MTEQCQDLNVTDGFRLLNVFEKFGFFQWCVRYVEYHSGILGIKVWCEACVIATLSSTEGTQIYVYKVIQKTRELRGYQRVKWLRI